MSDTLKIANSIWPNGMKVDSDGHAVFYPLGTNKIKVPTSSSEWPKGNKLVSPFVYQGDKLVGFVDTKALTTDSQITIYLPYEHIEAEFSAINKGQLQIHAPNATTKKASWKDSGEEDIAEVQFKYKGCTTIDNVKAVDPNYLTNDIIDGVWSEPLWDFEDSNPTNNITSGMFYWNLALTAVDTELPNLTNGCGMFRGCNNLTKINSDLSSLINGEHMFEYCTKLTSFSSDLSSLTNGEHMFYQCHNLTAFNSDLSSLTKNTYGMFDSCPLTTFSSNLSSLTNGSNMFSVCTNLTSFTSDLSSLTNGEWMFYYCTKLTSFSSNLSSLTNGSGMFSSCYLDTASVQNIADKIKDVSPVEDEDYGCMQNKTIDIGIGNTSPNEQEEAAFNKIAAKGWTVYVNGSQYTPTSPAAITTLDENGEETVTPIPFWAKPVQTDEEHAKYVDSEGNFFNILGGQFIYGDDISTYGMFTCEEDAAANMRLTPYIKPIENQ